MKRISFSLIAVTALVIPAVLVAQQAAPSTGVSEDEPFPWFDFLEDDPLPGGYEFSISIEDISFGGGTDPEMEAMMDMLFSEENRGVERNYFCVAGEVERFDFLEETSSDFAECEYNALNVEGNAFEVTAQCREPDGTRMRLHFSGESDADSIDAFMRMRTKGSEIGNITLGMRMALERVGDCSDLPAGEVIHVEDAGAQ